MRSDATNVRIIEIQLYDNGRDANIGMTHSTIYKFINTTISAQKGINKTWNDWRYMTSVSDVLFMFVFRWIVGSHSFCFLPYCLVSAISIRAKFNERWRDRSRCIGVETDDTLLSRIFLHIVANAYESFIIYPLLHCIKYTIGQVTHQANLAFSATPKSSRIKYLRILNASIRC